MAGLFPIFDFRLPIGGNHSLALAATGRSRIEAAVDFGIQAVDLTESGEGDEFDVGDDDVLRADVMERSGRRTVPQIFIDGRSIGGFEELRELDVAGELAGLRESRAG